MKIAIDTTPLLKDLSGVGHVTYQHAKQLMSNHPAEYTYYYAWFWSQTLRERPLAGYEKKVALAKKYLPRPYVVTHTLKTLIFNSGIILKQPDIFYQPNYISFPMIADVPTVTTVHDLSHIRYPEYHPQERVDYFEHYLQRSLDQSTQIVTVSQFTKDELIHFNMAEEEKISVVPNGVSKEFQPDFSPEDFTSTLSKYHLNQKQYLLSVGTLEPRKNIAMLLKLYDRLSKNNPHLPVLAIAGGKGWREEYFTEELEAALKNPKIIQLGYIPQSDLPILYAGARAFLFPAVYEGFGLPPLEAMASGTPVIASDAASIPEVVSKSGILLNPHNEDAWANAIMRICSDDLLCKQLSTQGLQQAKLFTWEKAADLLFNLFQAIHENHS